MCRRNVTVQRAAQADDGPGVFLGCIDLSTGLARGPVIHLGLAFSTVSHTFSGTAHVTQAVPNPVVWQGHAYGTFFAPLPGNTQFLVLTGSDVPPTTPIEPTLEFRLNTPATITLDGKPLPVPGAGWFRYMQGSQWTPWSEGTVTWVKCPTAGN